MNKQHLTLRESLRELPRGAWILFFGVFLNKFGTFVLPFLAIYMTRQGYRATDAGLAVGAYGVGTLGASLLGGYLADRFGRRRTIVASMLSVAGAMLCLSHARGLGSMVLWSGLAGLTGELYRPAASALLADLVPAGQRVTAYAAYRIAHNAGWAFGPATAGLLAKHSFLWLFIGDAATSVLFGFVAWLALPPGWVSRRGGGAWRETWLAVRGDARFLQVLCAALAMGLVFVQSFSTMSMEITSNGFGASTYGWVISLNGALIVVFELPIATIAKRFPARRVMALGYFLVGLGFATNLSLRTIPFFVLAVVLFSLGEMISMPVSAAYVADLAPADKRGLYMGTYGLVWAVALVCGPSLGLMLFAVNPTLLWAGCGVLGLLATCIISLEPKSRRA